MARPRTPQPPYHLVSARMLDVISGELIEPGDLLVEGDRITGVSPKSVPHDAVEIDLGDVTMLPGLMDMEVNLVMGGPNHASPLIPVQEDPALRMLRAVVNARRTLQAGFTTVRNLGLFVQTGGLLLDVALMKAIDMGWVDGPRIVPAGHAISPTGGHLDPTMFQALPLTFSPLRSRRESPMVWPKSARPCAIRSSTALGSSRSVPRVGSCHTPVRRVLVSTPPRS